MAAEPPTNGRCRIVLTGGPGAGKTTAADLFRREIGDRVVVVPEAATLLFSGGFPRVKEAHATRSAQAAIYHLQRNLEDIQAARFPERVLLCDRGTLDGAAYWPDDPAGFTWTPRPTASPTRRHSSQKTHRPAEAYRRARYQKARTAMLLSRIAPMGALLFLSTVAGCITATPGEDVTTSTDALKSETFKLYDDAAPEPSGRCDVYTLLTLSPERAKDVKDPFPSGMVLYGHLRNEVAGYCKLQVDPDPRNYVLLFSGEECGSTVYSASTTADGKARDITVTDHRRRACKDHVPAKIVVEERAESGDLLRTFHSFDGSKSLPVS
jgi:hypothetical protein